MHQHFERFGLAFFCRHIAWHNPSQLQGGLFNLRIGQHHPACRSGFGFARAMALGFGATGRNTAISIFGKTNNLGFCNVASHDQNRVFRRIKPTIIAERVFTVQPFDLVHITDDRLAIGMVGKQGRGERLAQLSRWISIRAHAPFFDDDIALRIDHVVGFFRIWGIPEEKKASEGSFFPPDPSLWPAQGREILSMMIDSSPLLPMAEDLGTIPKEVYPVLRDLGICSTKVIRWQRRWDSDKSYIPYSEYDPLSLTTLATPDSDTLSGWWKKFPDEAIPFAHFKQWPYRSDLTKEQRFAILRDAHHTPSYFHINLLQEYLSFFPDLVSTNPDDERINVPGTLLPTNWTYRFRPSVEELLANQPLAETIREILL